MIKSIGKYDYKKNKSEYAENLEYRPLYKFKDGPEYQGQWIVDTKIRQGCGKLTKPDGSAQSMKEVGQTANPTAKEGLFTLMVTCMMVTCMMENGRMVKEMVTEWSVQ